MKRRLTVALALGATLLMSACKLSVGTLDATVQPSARPLPFSEEPVAAVVARVLPSVVNVTTDVYRADPFGGSQTSKGVGTGFVVRSDGVIVTNCHVVEGASKITVTTSDQEPKSYQAYVIGGDCQHDLSVLKVDAQDLPALTLGNSSALQLGQRVVAVGYALALEGGPSVTAGIVSSLDRTIEAQDPNCTTCPNGVRTYKDVVQTDAAINQGNSGGPLVDMRGQVVGINSAGASNAENIGFAIAIDSTKQAIREAKGSPLEAGAYAGVRVQTVNQAVAAQFNLTVDQGALVRDLVPGSGAEDAGIEAGDVIVRIDGKKVTKAEDVSRILAASAPGDIVVFTVVRGSDGSRERLDVTLGTKPLPTVLP